MRNFGSKILAWAAAARPSPVHLAAGALARERLPFSLLILAAFAAVVFAWIANGQFGMLHHSIDGQNMAVASNLSIEHRFLMFTNRHVGADGEWRYAVYNRFPIGTYLLNKALIAPFGDSASAQIIAARLLSAAFFSGAAVLAYLGLRRITNQPWIALAATLLTFSSYHVFTWGDMISSEMNGVFGMLLTFHGMTVFAQEGRFRQLLVKAFAAILIHWQVMALLLPFTALGLAFAIFRAIRAAASSSFADKARAAFAALVSSRHLWLGAASLAFCALVMGFNAANEYIAFRGEIPLLDLPSVQSMLWRATILGDPSPKAAWLPLSELQLERVGGVSLPYLILPWLGHDSYGGDALGARDFGFWVGVIVSAAGLIGLAFTRDKLSAASLLLAGWIWALGVREGSAVSTHEYEALFHIGVPLIVFATILTVMSRRIKWSAVGAAAAAAAVIVFGISLSQFARFAHDEDPSTTAANSDLIAIRKITQGASVCVGPMSTIWGAFHAVDYYLADGIINHAFGPCSFGAAATDQFIVTPAYAESGALLTPRNKLAFLYDARRLSESPHETALRELSRREPVIQSTFSVYFDEDKLIYAKEPCSDLDARGLFFLRIRPVNNADLPPSASPTGFEWVTFAFGERGGRFDDVCLAYVILPDYPIERIHAGQFKGGEIWSAFFVLDDAVYRSASAEAALSEPDARGHFDLHLQDGRLLFLKDPCDSSDADARFFVHVHPVDGADLPQERKGHSFDNLNFNFDERGAFFDGKCAAIADLPAYPVERIGFGQFNDTGRIWSAFSVLDDAPYRSASAEAALSEPDARNYFDLYLQGDRLLLLKDPCEVSNTEARFYLHLHPVDNADLSGNAGNTLFDNLEFRFDERGAFFDGKCAAIADLPAYPVERIGFGQFNDIGRIWGGVFVLDDAPYRSASAEAALSEPDARGHFNLHLQDGRLLFLKDPCDPSDADARFFIHVQPVDSADLPQDRKEYSFDNRNFSFDERGAFFDGKCAAIADLPAYPVERVRFGQFDDAGEIWRAVFILDEAAYLSAVAEAALAEPDARNHFDLYLQDGRLLFLREPCEPSDAEASFFVHVHPVDGGDLPRERRRHGFDNLDFSFDERGAFFDGKCAAIVNLPAYPIKRIRVERTGGGEAWEASIAPGERR